MLSACAASSSRSREPARAPDLHGGTLRVGSFPLGISIEAPLPNEAEYALDPQFEYYGLTAWELFRCCLLRTLLQYRGWPNDSGGQLHPDLAAALPSVSADGLTWTFRLKRGLHYAPPFEGTEITAGDIVRALEREFRLGANGGYPFYYTVIRGTEAYAHRRTHSISGLEVRDRYTLLVHLKQPAGDLGYRFALPATAPIPPCADRGHDGGYGRFIVSSGPYMIAGSPRMDFSLPARRQHGAKGWIYDWAVRDGRPVLLRPESMLLVRNPSWNAETDPSRHAFPDRIHIAMRADGHALTRAVERNRLDVTLGELNPTEAALRRYLREPALRRRLHVSAGTSLQWITINTAEPPFDDVHVRRALAYAVNRASLVHLENVTPTAYGTVRATIASHAFPDSFEGGLLSAYDPFGTPGDRGDLVAARRELARSRYDNNHDGRCDAAACRRVLAVGTASDAAPKQAVLDREIARDLRPLGISLAIRHGTLSEMIRYITPRAHMALLLDGAWQADFPDASTFAPVLQHPSGHLSDDVSMLGATRVQLRRWGYRTRSVPNVDADIARCRAAAGSWRQSCWAELDQRLMERVIPYVPWGEAVQLQLVSRRVRHYRFDHAENAPALDELSVRR